MPILHRTHTRWQLKSVSGKFLVNKLLLCVTPLFLSPVKEGLNAYLCLTPLKHRRNVIVKEQPIDDFCQQWLMLG